MWGTILTFLGSSVKSYFDHKQKKNELKQELELKQLSQESDWDTKNADARKGSWADEWFIILWSIPLIPLFISPFVDIYMSTEPYREGQLMEASYKALEGLDKAPDYYVTVLLIMVAASFGYRKLADFAIKRNTTK